MTCIWPLINTKITEISTLLASIVSIFKDVCNMFEPAWTGWLQIIMMRNPRVGHCTALRSDNDKIRAFWACQNLSIFGCTCVKTKTPGCIVQKKLNRSFSHPRIKSYWTDWNWAKTLAIHIYDVFSYFVEVTPANFLNRVVFQR